MIVRRPDGSWDIHSDDERACDLDAGCVRLLARRRWSTRGDTWVYAFQVVRDAASGRLYTARRPALIPPGAVPHDLTGAKIWLTAKRFASDSDFLALAQLVSPSSGVILTTQTQGMCTATMPSAVTLSLPDMGTEFAYDVQVLLAGVTSTVEVGTLVVSPDVTRATS